MVLIQMSRRIALASWSVCVFSFEIICKYLLIQTKIKEMIVLLTFFCINIDLKMFNQNDQTTQSVYYEKFKATDTI